MEFNNIEQQIIQLWKDTDLKNKITSSTIPQEKKGQLVFEIDKALKNFEEYSKHIEKLEIQ